MLPHEQITSAVHEQVPLQGELCSKHVPRATYPQVSMASSRLPSFTRSQVRTTETILAHLVYRQSHHNCKTLAPLLPSPTSSIPQQHGKARLAASKHRCRTRRIASQQPAHDSHSRALTHAPLHLRNADYQYERARRFISPYLCLA